MSDTNQQHPRQIGAPVAKHGRRQQKGFAATTAELTGQSVRAIQRDLARADALGDDLDRIVGTSLDKGVELDALAKLPAPERKELIDRAVAGQRVSAAKALRTEKLVVRLQADNLQELHQKLLRALAVVETHMKAASK